ncbi:MAG: GNAT family N-acetyltransferase [Paracoccaceae bacterium]
MSKDITFRHLGPSDLNLMLSIREGLFDNPVDPAQAAAFLNDPGHEIVLAFAGEEAVGMVTGTVLLHPDKPPAMFVNEVGVRENWQRRGIAREIMERFFVIARERGCKGIWLGTEPDNHAALSLYRSLDGDEESFVGFGWDDAL